VTVSEQDSLMYMAGENAYTVGDCKKASDNFKKYLDKFPQGSFILNAYYYKGDCSLKAGDFDEAMNAFNFVIARPRNSFSEQALAKAAQLKMNKKDYQAALSNYLVLDSIAEIEQNSIDARVGQMLAYYYLNQFTDAVGASQKVLKTSGIATETERKARYIQAKSLLALNEKLKALELLKKLSTDVKNVEGAESKFLLAKSYFDNAQPEKAQKEIFNFIDLNSPHQYWVAKAYLLLAEIYHAKKDDFQATNTLQSIIDNYDNKDDGIVKEATEKKAGYEGKTIPEKSTQNDDRENN
jgi:TolA-binding protein